MSNVDTDWLETLIEQIRTTQPAYSRYFQNELDQIFKRVHSAPGGIPGDDTRRPRCEQSDGMLGGRDRNDWRLGFESALSGWTDIPPARAHRESRLAGRQAGRAQGRLLERESCRHADREATALPC